MTNPLDYIRENIEKREKRLTALDHERVTVLAELGAYKDMLTQFNGSTALPKTAAAPPASSPTAFQMSPEWTAIIQALDKRGKSFSAADVILIGKGKGISLTVPSVRSQFAHYTKRGYFRKVARGKYMITPKGREKFGAGTELNQGQLALNENDPSQVTGNGSDTGGGAA